MHISNFKRKLNAYEYCDWIASLEAFFEWNNVSEEKKGSNCGNKVKRPWIDMVAIIPMIKRRGGIPRIALWAEIKLKMDEKFTPSKYSQNLYRKFHTFH